MTKYALLLVAVAVVTACRREPSRPDGVPADAVLTPTPKGGMWQVCIPPTQAVRRVSCSIYSLGGRILYSEDFEAVDEQPVGPQLEIDPTAALVGPPWIHLKGGRILVPASRAEEVRRFLAGSK